MKFTTTLKFLGLEKRTFQGNEYSLINLLDLSTNKVFTCFIDTNKLSDIQVFKQGDDITCLFELTKRIQNNKEIPALSLLEVHNIGKAKA